MPKIGTLEIYPFKTDSPPIKKIKEINFFTKTDKIIFLKKQVISSDFYQAKLENPQWIYLYKKENLTLEKSINTEYFYPPKFNKEMH